MLREELWVRRVRLEGSSSAPVPASITLAAGMAVMTGYEMTCPRAREKMCAVNVSVEAVIASGPETAQELAGRRRRGNSGPGGRPRGTGGGDGGDVGRDGSVRKLGTSNSSRATRQCRAASCSCQETCLPCDSGVPFHLAAGSLFILPVPGRGCPAHGRALRGIRLAWH